MHRSAPFLLIASKEIRKQSMITGSCQEAGIGDARLVIGQFSLDRTFNDCYGGKEFEKELQCSYLDA